MIVNIVPTIPIVCHLVPKFDCALHLALASGKAFPSKSNFGIFGILGVKLIMPQMLEISKHYIW
jgi:hypothetical protein